MSAGAGLPENAALDDSLQPISESDHFLPIQGCLQLTFGMAAIAAELVLEFYQIRQ